MLKADTLGSTGQKDVVAAASYRQMTSTIHDWSPFPERPGNLLILTTFPRFPRIYGILAALDDVVLSVLNADIFIPERYLLSKMLLTVST